MKLLSSFNEMFDKVKSAFLNFPITLIWAVVGTIYLIWFVGQEIESDVEFSYIKPILVFILGMSWVIATRLLVRYFKEERKQKKYWLLLIPLLLLGIYYYSLPNNQVGFDDVTIPYRFVLYFIAGHLLIFFTPFLFTWDKNAYWNYLKSIFLAFVKSVVFSIVLYLGLTIALLSLKYLFKLDFDELIYFKLFIFSVGIVNTWIFLGDIPSAIQKQTTIDYPKALLVFVKYILIPLTLLYLVILYAYSLKILINWNLPKGWVSYLLIALSVLGFLIHILINPIKTTNKSKLIKSFYPWFYYSLLPLIVLLFVAIFKRIFNYGFTENRYMVLILSFWILGMTLYVLFSKQKKLRNFPMSVAVLSILMSFGVWGVFSVSKKSQAKQFKALYHSMESTGFKVKNSELQRFESISKYLAERNALDNVTDVLGFKPSEVFTDKNHWLIADRLRDTLGIVVIDMDDVVENRVKGYYKSVYNELLDVRGYDYIKQVFIDDYTRQGKRRKNVVSKRINKFSFELDSISKVALFIIKEKDTLHKIDLKDFLDKIEKEDTAELSQDKMTLIREFEDINVKFLFQSIELKRKKSKLLTPKEILRIDARILLKEKQIRK